MSEQPFVEQLRAVADEAVRRAEVRALEDRELSPGIRAELERVHAALGTILAGPAAPAAPARSLEDRRAEIDRLIGRPLARGTGRSYDQGSSIRRADVADWDPVRPTPPLESGGAAPSAAGAVQRSQQGAGPAVSGGRERPDTTD